MKIIVIGDILLDINHHVTTTRMSAEVNIPIYNVCHTDYILGGASNVAHNLNNLSCETILISIVGNDMYSEKVKELLNATNIYSTLFISDKTTTQKNRLFLDKKQIHRYDIENTEYIGQKTENEIFNFLESLEHIDGIIISDYEKGLLTPSLTKRIIDYSFQKNIFTFVDPKIKDYAKYKNCFLFKPNFLEATQISGKSDKSDMIQYIHDQLQCQNILLTDGKNGMSLYHNNQIHPIHQPVTEVVDVTGAGDIVITIIAYVFLKTNDLLLATKIANYVAGKSIQTIGNYIASERDIHEYDWITNKVLSLDDTDKIAFLRNKYKKIVFTNGCFDLVHSAHIDLLQFAKNKGDLLIVGLNSDSSIQKLKGITRPINKVDERVHILKTFPFVDYIVVFEDSTPLNIIKTIKPDILVKGGDYKWENIVGKEYVKDVVLFHYIQQKSTSHTIQNILQRYDYSKNENKTK